MTKEELIKIKEELELAINEILEIRQGETRDSKAIYPLNRLFELKENITRRIEEEK